MYDGSTSSATTAPTNDERFRDILKHASDTIADRLRSYDAKTDPLKKSHLKLLFDIVSIEVDRASAGLGYIYAGLEPPIRAVRDWGEPADSKLISALHDAETFFRRDYRPGRDRPQTLH
jgi:hypothetical protein